MTPVKISEFLTETETSAADARVLDLLQLGMFHAAPRENGVPLLALRFDAESGTLLPVG